MSRARRPGMPAGGDEEAASTAPESWFTALGVGRDTQLDDDRESGYAAWGQAVDEDSRFLTRHAYRLLSSNQPSFERLYRAFLGARMVVAVVLLCTQAATYLLGQAESWLPVAVCLGYALLAVAWGWRGRRSQGRERPRTGLRRLDWVATIALDVAVFGSLHLLAPRGVLSYVPLLALPVLMSGVLTRRVAALGVAAAVALLLLAQAWLSVMQGGDVGPLMTQAGLIGIGYFVIAFLAGELATRLAREELAAKGSLELARQQAQLNRLVIEELQEGVLVVDRRLRVRALNPAAHRLLTDDELAPARVTRLDAHTTWAPLAEAVRIAFRDRNWPAAGREITLQPVGLEARALRVRMRFTRGRETPEDLCLLFLEDLRDVQARIRQEKLAAMGRISAGIAHEIRNPLAAIAQANALMAEDAQSPDQRQLTQMVADNVERLKRIVDDVMEVAPGGPPTHAPVIDMTALVATTCSEWARTNRLALGERSPLKVDLPGSPLGARFDADHLRRVLVNLLDNAYRHASGKPGSVELRLAADGAEVVLLSVASDGPPIPPDVERHLFEPFFSTRSRGTGLGLYICKELCERYGATIDYRLRGAAYNARNEFFVMMRSEPIDAPEASLNLAR
jgi:two-component system sensor histidine kinase PilS (NtrC family)